MTKIQDVHPTVCHSMDVTVKILQNAIQYRQREIASMEDAIKALHVVRADEALPRLEHAPEDLAQITARLEAAVATELSTNPPVEPVRFNGASSPRQLKAFRAAAKDGVDGDVAP